MRLRKVMLVATLALLLIAAAAGMGFAWLKYSPRSTPAGQPALSRLDGTTLAAFRDAFNASAAESRIVVLLSPT